MKVLFADLDMSLAAGLRDSINDDAIAAYVEDFDNLPQPVVFDTGDRPLLLADGYHRCIAAQAKSLDGIEALVKKGTALDAEEYSIEANLTNGVQLTKKERGQARKRLVTIKHERLAASAGPLLAQPGGTLRLVAAQLGVSKGALEYALAPEPHAKARAVRRHAAVRTATRPATASRRQLHAAVQAARNNSIELAIRDVLVHIFNAGASSERLAVVLTTSTEDLGDLTRDESEALQADASRAVEVLSALSQQIQTAVLRTLRDRQTQVRVLA